MANTGSRTKAKNRDAMAVERVVKAIELRAQKYTYRDIALKCGYASGGACHDAIMRELERSVYEAVDELRREELYSLETLESECWERLHDDRFVTSKMFTVDRIVNIKERRARLMGLDIPTGTNINPNLVIIREVPAGLLPTPPVVNP